MLFNGIALQILQVLLQPGVCVRIAMRDVNSIVIVVKLQGKGETAVVSSKLAFHIVCVVADLSALAHPANSFRHRSLLGVNKRLHAHVVKTVGFEQVYDVESVLHVFPGVGHRQEVPLRVAVGVVVRCQDQIVLKLQSKLDIGRYFWMTRRRLPHSNLD